MANYPRAFGVRFHGEFIILYGNVNPGILSELDRERILRMKRDASDYLSFETRNFERVSDDIERLIK